MENAVIAGLPIMALVIGIVQFTKEKLGWSGKGVEVFAICLGLAVGFAYHAYQAADPIAWDFRFIFEGIVYGFAVGLGATGIYKWTTQGTNPEPLG